MATFGENFRGGADFVMCPLCGTHRDTQLLGFRQCPKLAEYITIKGEYEDIHRGNISTDLAQTLVKIENFRQEYEN